MLTTALIGLGVLLVLAALIGWVEGRAQARALDRVAPPFVDPQPRGGARRHECGFRNCPHRTGARGTSAGR